MEQYVVTVEALRCHQCMKLIHPTQEEFRRRQMMTAVDHGLRIGRVNRYEMVTLCVACDEAWEVIDAEQQHQLWWRRFWFITVAAGLVLSGFFWWGFVPVYVAILVRVVWKWRARKRQRALPPPAASVKPPLAP